MPIINFNSTMCKHCYKCVRSCDVKSIMIRDACAYVMPNRCILCGQCLLQCPQQAKTVKQSLDLVKGMIDDGYRVIATLSSSYMGVLPFNERGQVKTALKRLGFFDVRDVAEGAALATEEYVRLISEGKMKNIISTACPSIMDLLEIHYPELVDSIAPVIRPSGIHTSMLKAEYGEETKVIYIGPCVAEKAGSRASAPDAAITFKELKLWLQEEGIVIEECDSEDFSDEMAGVNLRYPVSGGLLASVLATKTKPDNYRKFYVSGVKDCIDVCEALKTGEVAGCFIEMNACHGGCINGPETAAEVSSFKVKLDLEATLPTYPADLSKLDEKSRSVNVHRTFMPRPQKEPIPTEEELREILKKTGKNRPEQELNCGACGYPTCRDKAIAVYQKKAEVDMCIPYLHERNSSLSHMVMETSPNIIMVLDENYNVVDVSASAERYFHVSTKTMKGKRLDDFISSENVQEVFRTHRSIRSKKVAYSELELITLQNISYVKEGNFVILTLIDVTREEIQMRQELKKKKETIDLAQNVILKQMMVAQEIAGLLGETTAETQTALTKLCKMIEGPGESEVR